MCVSGGVCVRLRTWNCHKRSKHLCRRDTSISCCFLPSDEVYICHMPLVGENYFLPEHERALRIFQRNQSLFWWLSAGLKSGLCTADTFKSLTFWQNQNKKKFFFFLTRKLHAVILTGTSNVHFYSHRRFFQLVYELEWSFWNRQHINPGESTGTHCICRAMTFLLNYA